MTSKLTIIREELLNIIETDHVQCGEASALARMALAAMDSEPDRNPVLAYADSYRDMAKQGVESVPIWSVITDLERNIAPLYRHAQPVPEHPEVLPCSVLLEPGLRFGKGIKTSTMLAALARRAVYESDLAALSPEERAEFLTGIEDFKALIAQPAPVVPDELLKEYLRLVDCMLSDYRDSNYGDAQRWIRHIADASDAFEEKHGLSPWEMARKNFRAAMLAPAPQEVK
ncbi:TPA: hypothetical protein ACF3KM_004919 [Klebsiella quasipneumoniae subsp. quasipneumoniae]